MNLPNFASSIKRQAIFDMVRHKNGFKDTVARRRKETLATEGTQEQINKLKTQERF